MTVRAWFRQLAFPKDVYIEEIREAIRRDDPKLIAHWMYGYLRYIRNGVNRPLMTYPTKAETDALLLRIHELWWLVGSDI